MARADDEPERHLTVMVAPLRAIIPLGEITVEYAINQKLGASIELGAGRRTISAGSDEATGTEIEGGAQVRYYALGSFRHGMELGGEILEEYVKFQEPLPGNIVGAAAGGATLGAFVGYKVIMRVGFTFEAQLGARYLIVDPRSPGKRPACPRSTNGRRSYTSTSVGRFSADVLRTASAASVRLSQSPSHASCDA